jgi:hypothetical protein
MSEPNHGPDFSIIRAGAVDPDIHRQAGRAAFDYTVSFIQNWEQRGSGSLVEINGTKGILTAHHVAEPIFANRNHPIGVIISEGRHRFEFTHEELEHIPAQSTGIILDGVRLPDVSFIKILNPERLGTIGALRSFYPLRRTLESSFLREFGDQSPLIVIGAPVSHGEIAEHRDHFVFSATHFAAIAQFIDRDNYGSFSVMKVIVHSGVHNFPENYNGFSGGGIWTVPLIWDETVTPPRMTFEAPILTGISFYQSALQEDSRIIQGFEISSVISALDL